MNPHASFNWSLLWEYETLTCTEFICSFGNISELNSKVFRCQSKTISLLEPIISLKTENKIIKLNYQLNIPHQNVKFNRIPYENEKWAAHGQPMCCPWAAHVLHMGCPLKQWAAQWTRAAHYLCKLIIISAPGLPMGSADCKITYWAAQWAAPTLTLRK